MKKCDVRSALSVFRDLGGVIEIKVDGDAGFKLDGGFGGS